MYQSLILTCIAAFLIVTATQVNSFLLSNDPPMKALRVASFNVKHYGKTYATYDSSMANLVQILQRYDLVFMQETRDKSEDSLNTLRKLLGESDWEYVASEPVGRTSYKEQYVFFYRPAVVSFHSASIFDDAVKDVFEREPYVAQFSYWSLDAGAEVKVTLVGAHLTPDDVVVEIEALTGVINFAEHLFPDSEATLAMGDFNADCSYLNNAERANVTLFHTSDLYTSLIPDSADSSVAHGTHCAYDRVVLSPPQGDSKVKPTNAKVYDFQIGLGLSDADAALVSDHFPVEFTLE